MTAVEGLPLKLVKNLPFLCWKHVFLVQTNTTKKKHLEVERAQFFEPELSSSFECWARTTPNLPKYPSSLLQAELFTNKNFKILARAYFELFWNLGLLCLEPGAWAYLLQAKNLAQAFEPEPRLVPLLVHLLLSLRIPWLNIHRKPSSAKLLLTPNTLRPGSWCGCGASRTLDLRRSSRGSSTSCLEKRESKFRAGTGTQPGSKAWRKSSQ